jgi:ketosteroid isomerase-like protein
MSTTDATAVIATKSLQAWTTGDFAKTRALCHDDVTFVGPLGTADGVEDYMNGVRGLSKIVKAAEPRKVLADGDDVCIIYDLVTDTPAGTVPTVAWYHVEDGKIASVRAFFDPRSLTDSGAIPKPSRSATDEVSAQAADSNRFENWELVGPDVTRS